MTGPVVRSPRASCRCPLAQYGKEAYVQYGRGEFIGTTKTDGTDREQRDSGRKYRKASLTNPRFVELTTSGKSFSNRWGAATDQGGRPEHQRGFQEGKLHEDLAISEDARFRGGALPDLQPHKMQAPPTRLFSGDGGDFVIGLEDGAILDVNELEAVMKLARLVWVQSVRSTGEPVAPRWMEKVPGLDSYFAKLGSGLLILRNMRTTKTQSMTSEQTQAFRTARSSYGNSSPRAVG